MAKAFLPQNLPASHYASARWWDGTPFTTQQRLLGAGKEHWQAWQTLCGLRGCPRLGHEPMGHPQVPEKQPIHGCVHGSKKPMPTHMPFSEQKGVPSRLVAPRESRDDMVNTNPRDHLPLPLCAAPSIHDACLMFGPFQRQCVTLHLSLWPKLHWQERHLTQELHTFLGWAATETVTPHMGGQLYSLYEMPRSRVSQQQRLWMVRTPRGMMGCIQSKNLGKQNIE